MPVQILVSVRWGDACSFDLRVLHNVFADSVDQNLHICKKAADLVGIHLDKGDVIVLLSFVKGSM